MKESKLDATEANCCGRTAMLGVPPLLFLPHCYLLLVYLLGVVINDLPAHLASRCCCSFVSYDVTIMSL